MGLPITYLSPEIPVPSAPDGPGSYYTYRKRSKQIKPFNLPAAYDTRKVRTVYAKLYGTATSYAGMASASSNSGDYLVQPDLTQTAVIKGYIDDAVFKARSALLGTLNEQALLATNYVQRKLAVDMMADRLTQLANFARAVKRGDVRSAAWILRNKSKSGERAKWTNSKDAANTWLEFHFGWEPLIQDVFNVMKLLSDPLPGGYVSTDHIASPPGKVKFDRELLGTQNSGTLYPTYWSRSCYGFVKAKAGAEFYVSNPNLYLLNRLGLVNPMAIAWEAIPFSFVVDWFFTTSAYINQYSDLLGIKVQNPWYNWRAQVGSVYDTRTVHKPTGNVVHRVTVRKDAFNSRRLLGIPEVNLRTLPAKRLSLVRAATAISLLIGFLPDKYRLERFEKGPPGWDSAPRRKT